MPDKYKLVKCTLVIPQGEELSGRQRHRGHSCAPTQTHSSMIPGLPWVSWTFYTSLKPTLKMQSLAVSLSWSFLEERTGDDSLLSSLKCRFLKLFPTFLFCLSIL